MKCRLQAAVLAFFVIAMSGCRSAYVDATVHNGTGAAVSVVEVDYPSASFGTTSLPADADFHYRFKILGNGPAKVMWTDAARQEHSADGPQLVEGSEGPMLVTLTPKGAQWVVNVKKIH